jgi:hypothetical protein
LTCQGSVVYDINVKTCKDCKLDKPLSEFYSYTRNDVVKYFAHCKKCNKDRTDAWTAANPEKAKDIQARHYAKHRTEAKEYYIQKTYGLSPEEYEALLNANGRRCYICDKHESECAKGLHVDHNHITGKIRGVLCFSCNAAIGYLKESPELLDRAKAYITS